MRHTEPFLALSNDAAANVPQSDVAAVAALCTVLSKFGTAVADGPRLENLSWRLWHRARSQSQTCTSDDSEATSLLPSSSSVGHYQGQRLHTAVATRMLPLLEAPSQRQNAEQGRVRVRNITLPVSEGWSGHVMGGPLTPADERQRDGGAGGGLMPSDDIVGVSPVSPHRQPSVGNLISQLFAHSVVTQWRQSSHILESTSSTSSPRQPFPTLVVVTPTPHPTPPATPSPGAGEGDASFHHLDHIFRPRSSSKSAYNHHYSQECHEIAPGSFTSSQGTNGQLATPTSVNSYVRGNLVVAPGSTGFFANSSFVEVPTDAAMPVHLEAGSDDAVSQSARALLPAASIGAPVVVSSGPTLSPAEECSTNGVCNDELLASSTEITGLAVHSPSPKASSNIATTSTATSPLSTPASTPVTPSVTAPVRASPSNSSSLLVQEPTIPAVSTTLPAIFPPSGSADPDPCPTPPHGMKYTAAEEKKFFLAARRSEGSMGSGISSDSPESGSVGSGSGKSGSVGMGRDALLGAMWGREALLAKALAGREAAHGDVDTVGKGMEGAASMVVEGATKGVASTSPGDDIRLSSLMKGKARVGPGLGSSGLGGKRKSGVKKDEGLVGEVQGDVKGDMKLETQRKSVERQYESTGKGKDKERVVAGGAGETSKGTSPGTSAPRPGLLATRSLQQLPSHRHVHSHGPHVHPHGHGHPSAHANHHGHPYVQPHPSHHLRQLPTNPPRRQHSPARKSAAATKSPSGHSSHGRGNTADSMQSRRHNDSTQSRPSHSDVSYTHAHLPTPAPAPDGLMTRHLPYHPQLSHLGLGHLPTVPPKQRRPIEITETSSEYETTDTEGEESSWESESFSGEETGAGARDGSSKHGRVAGDGTSKNGKGATSANTQRTRDAGEFARDAALEAQRQRDLFQKLPPRSYSNLAQLPRAKSGLSLLFRPDPELFPEGHPYRTSKSSRDLLARTWSAPAPPLAVTALSKRGSPVRPMPAAVNAVPVVTSVNSQTSTMGATGGSTERYSGSGGLRGGYRPRAKPADQEEETDSGEDDPDDVIQLSSSVAQRRLAALMGRRGRQSQQHLRHPSSLHATSSPPASALANQASPPSMPRPVTRTTTAPVLMHPYLPDPAPLQTPHTVRRNIISQELDEELRRNLLWERSQNQIQGRPPRAAGSILPGPWRRMTSSRPEEEPSGEPQSQTNEDKAPGRRPFGTQRTKSWAGDFHASGW